MKKFKLSKNTRNALFVFLIAFSAFLAFEPLFENLGQKAAQEFAAAIFGTIFAAVITMVLLSKQTETEEEKSRSEKVFEEKLSLYNKAIDALQNIFKKADGNNQVKIPQADIIELEFILAKLIMIANNKTIHEFRLICKNLSNSYSPTDNMLSINSTDKHMLLRFADYCREELGLSNKNIEKEILEDIVLDSELFTQLKQLKRYPVNLIETLKDMYGYVVLDMSIPLQQIAYTSNGFTVQSIDSDDTLMECMLNNNELTAYIAHPTNHKMKHFKLDASNRFTITAAERDMFLDDFTNIQKSIQL